MIPAPPNELISEAELADMTRRATYWLNQDMEEGNHHVCSQHILDLIAELSRLRAGEQAREGRAQRYENALRAICTTSDSGPWIEVYRAAGGGYEGLQAIAETALVAPSTGREGTG